VSDAAEPLGLGAELKGFGHALAKDLLFFRTRVESALVLRKLQNQKADSSSLHSSE
jgi:hypothetical protein